MQEIRTSGSMSGDGKRSVAAWPKLPRPSSTLPKRARGYATACPQLADAFRLMGVNVGRIPQSLADLPVVQASKFELVINASGGLFPALPTALGAGAMQRCLLGVKSLGLTRPTTSRHVRCASDSDRIGDSRQSVAWCQFLP
jgi:hypothetical protein